MEVAKSLKDEKASRDACQLTLVGTLSVRGARDCVDGDNLFGAVGSS